jgi:hypothetical protein
MRATLDAIRRGLAEVWDTGGRSFVTFELEGEGDVWVQWIDGQVNVRWPLDRDPAQELPARGVRLPRGAAIVSWTPGGTLHLGAWDVRADDAAELIESLFARVLAGSARFRLETRVDRA